ncbi:MULTISPECIES: ImmA/IrrE family metallo-endopeptidase [Paenibacillus]|uniref:ImmA/IrrE family metallo-endopeptidase n=1 Tax=Paenibacillus TaxID=44249 RepID=UPI00038F9138|nr:MULTISPECIES: ImmA/IrrE family metallo-endopeptidase [Paenibacillus]
MMNIRQRTRNLFRTYGVTCPFRLSEEMGISVLRHPLPSGMKGFCQHAFRRRFIVLSDRLEEAEAVFVCAHELGHMLLHKGFSHSFITLRTRFVLSRYEREANEFAVKLLTCGERPEEGEQLQSFLRRCGIPPGMDKHFW